jgi:alpha-1,6-mannosyltransferase
LLLFAGRLTRAKGLSALVAALDQLAPDGPPCHLALVGGGECAAWAQALAARRSNLTWLPHCESTDRLADLYSAADLFVYPGVSDTRAFAALEAQACGTPVLAVRGGGLEEVLAADPSPLFADDATSAALARALESARRRPELMPAERAARHRALIERFSIDRTFARIFALYREQLGSRPARGGPSG